MFIRSTFATLALFALAALAAGCNVSSMTPTDPNSAGLAPEGRLAPRPYSPELDNPRNPARVRPRFSEAEVGVGERDFGRPGNVSIGGGSGNVGNVSIGGGGGLGATAAMQRMYGSYNSNLRRSQWEPSPAELRAFNFDSDLRSVYSRVLFNKYFTQNGVSRQILLTRTSPLAEECPTCAPVLGGATFSLVNGRWQMDDGATYITKLGAMSKTPDARLVKIGANRYGVLLHWTYTSAGITEENHSLVTEANGQLREVLALTTGGNNNDECHDDNLNRDECWAYNSRLEFVPIADSVYSDLQIVSRGAKQEGNRIVPVSETRRYIFDGNAYRLYR